MSICIGNTRLPDIPKDIIDNYPYHAIFQLPIADDFTRVGTCLLVMSTNNLVFAPSGITSNITEDSIGAEQGSSVKVYIYNTSDLLFVGDWVSYISYEDIQSDTTVSLGDPKCIYSNNTIYKISGIDSDGKFVVTEDVYFYKSIKLNDNYIQGLPSDKALNSSSYEVVLQYIPNFEDLTNNMIIYIQSSHPFVCNEKILHTFYLQTDENATSNVIYYAQGISTNWDVGSMDDSEISFGPLNISTFSIIWANHDVMKTLKDGSTEIFFLSSTDVYPDNVNISSKFIKNIANQERLILKSKERLDLDNIQYSMENELPDGYRWMINFIKHPQTDETAGLIEEVAIIIGQLPYIDYDTTNINPKPFSFTGISGSAVFCNTVSIGNMAFAGAIYLRAIAANRCTFVGNGAFSNCETLAGVFFESLETIDALAFYRCETLEYISGMSNVVTVGNNAFKLCVALPEISLPSVITIGDAVFDGCTSLSKIDLGLAETLGEKPFINCESLETLIIRNAAKICTIESPDSNDTWYPFDNTPIASGTGYIYVPSALVNSYKSASGWSTYANQFRAIEDYPDICNVAE